MRQFFVFLFALLLGCSTLTKPAPVVPPSHAEASVETDAVDLTVALITNEGTFCAGVWVGPHSVLTAAHCVQDNKFVVDGVTQVEDHDLAVAEAKVLKVSEHQDLALLGVPAMSHNYANVALSWSQGEELTIVGHPNGEKWVWMRGWIEKAILYSGPFDNINDVAYLRVQAPIWYGNSGGGAWDHAGNLVGIASMMSQVQPTLGWFVSAEEVHAFLSAAHNGS